MPPIECTQIHEYDPVDGVLVNKILQLLEENPSAMFFHEEVANSVGIKADAADTLLRILAESGRVESRTVLDPHTGELRVVYGTVRDKPDWDY